jgi:hypothetical protein
MTKKNSIPNEAESENPIRPTTVRKMDTITIHCVRNRRIIRGLISADKIVMNDIDIDTYPAYEDGTPKAICMVGHPEPRRESGRPRLTNIRKITASSKEYITSLQIYKCSRSITSYPAC